MARQQLFAACAVAFLSFRCGSPDTHGQCSVEEQDGGARISCPDGTSGIIRHGDDGADGQNGADGDEGQGASADRVCTVYDADEGAIIYCADGSSAVIYDGAQGLDGASGTSCSVAETTNGTRITCDDGSTATVLDGADGQDGADGSATADGNSNSPNYSSGTRLEVKHVTGDDGSISYRGFYDTALDIDCSITPHVDGLLRCLPLAGASVASYFADSACSVRVAFASTTDPVYVTEYSLDLKAYRIYHAGAAYTGPSYLLLGEECSEVSLPADLMYYTVGTEVPGDAFVAFTE